MEGLVFLLTGDAGRYKAHSSPAARAAALAGADYIDARTGGSITGV